MKKPVIKVAVLVVAVSILTTLFACGVPQKDVDALKQQLTAKEQEATAAKQETATLKQRAAWFIRPDAPPRQPAPPPLPGTPPPTPPTPPPAKVVPLFFYVDTVTAAAGESKYKVDATVGCARTSVFKRGQRIVWRMEVVDTSTGKVLQAADVKQAILKLPHGEEIKLSYGRHGATADSPWFWAVGWDIPPDYPLGNLNYRIEVVTNDGKTGTFTEMKLLPDTVESLQKTRPEPDKWKMTDAGLTIIE